MGIENGPVLVPLDFSEQSFIALSQSYNMARLTHSSLRLLHVIDQDFFTQLTEGFLSKYNYADTLKEDLSARLDELATKIQSEEHISVGTIIRTGKIYNEIVEESDDCKASLLIMGTMGASTLKKKFLGSNTSRVIREAHCPVLTIKGKTHRTGCKNIVLPLDLTKETKEKVNKTIEVARLFNSQIHILSVIENDDEFIVKKLQRQLQQVEDFVRNENINCTATFIENKEVAETINNFAQEVNADLVVIMTQQELEFTDLFLGPKAQEIINRCEMPVLCIRPVAKKNLTKFVVS